MADIKHSIQIDATAQRVFPLAASAEGFSRWWAADVTEAAAGRSVELGFFNRATIYRLQPIQIAVPRQAHWLCDSGKEWGGTRLLFDLAEQNGKTLLRFTHAGWQSETDYMISCTTTWGELMFRLKATAEGKEPGPLFSATGLAY